STNDQSEERQLLSMRKFGISAENIFVDKQSGQNFERPAYKKLLERLKPADLVVIESLDRLGRNYFEIPEQWRIITREKRANIFVLDMPILDTRRKKDLIGTLVQDIILLVLSYVAQSEREFMIRRQAAGIAAAKARGIKCGRPGKPKPPNYEEVLMRWESGEISARQAGKMLNVNHSTFLNWARKKY
ncbi:MAG: recombinase family protein, partial [Selenomonadaceae bacterium]|nr:recombinase family protein [Selenomonadaceae bacterium]